MDAASAAAPRTARGPRGKGRDMGGKRLARAVAAGVACAAAAFALGGCSGTFQLVSDAADAAFEGLSDAADAAMGAASDAADAVMSALSDATGAAADGAAAAAGPFAQSAKDAALEAFDGLVGRAGASALTPDGELQGVRVAGADGYTGSYLASYRGFSGRETVFGGTDLGLDGGETVELACSLKVDAGHADVVVLRGAGEPEVLLDADGSGTFDVDVAGGSVYVAVRGDGFSGSVELESVRVRG